MAVPVVLPRIGQSVESCLITTWHKKIGDAVKQNDLLYSYETDKATFDGEAPASGTLLAILFDEGEDVPCLKNIAVIGEAGEDISAFYPEHADQAPAQENNPAENLNQESNLDLTIPAEAANSDGSRFFISPRAKRLAEKECVDFRQAKGSGANGRVMERDISLLIGQGAVSTKAAYSQMVSSAEQFEGTGIGGRVTTNDLGAKPAPETVSSAVTAPAASEYEDIPLTKIRQVISSAMMQSLSSMAQLTYQSTFDASKIMSLRKMFKESSRDLDVSDITFNDMILFAVSRALPNHKNLNANFDGSKIRVFKDVNLGVAVDTDRGLMVPTIFQANRKSLKQISAEVKVLAEQCKKGTINPDMLKGGTFTVSNLGTFGITFFTPIINPPQTGILGVGNIVNQNKLVNGSYENYPAMGLSLTADHRIVDGVPAANFLKEVCTNLENILALLAK